MAVRVMIDFMAVMLIPTLIASLARKAMMSFMVYVVSTLLMVVQAMTVSLVVSTTTLLRVEQVLISCKVEKALIQQVMPMIQWE